MSNFHFTNGKMLIDLFCTRSTHQFVKMADEEVAALVVDNGSGTYYLIPIFKLECSCNSCEKHDSVMRL